MRLDETGSRKSWGFFGEGCSQYSHITVLHKAEVVAYSEGASIKDALVRQLYSPVRWMEPYRPLPHKGVVHAAECGPGKVLAGLNKRIVSDMTCFALTGVDAVAEAKNQLNG